MVVIQNYYEDKDEIRRDEIRECLQNNVDNAYIDKVILVVETDARPTIQSGKIVIVEHHRRPTYSDMFEIANTYCPDEIVAICNSDIYFNHTISLCFDMGENDCYALSRWNERNKKLIPFHHSDSQDVWIMRTPIKKVETGFTLGKPGSDNRIAFILNEAGYTLTNPCNKIFAIHRHDNDKHNYTAADRVQPPYLRVIPQ